MQCPSCDAELWGIEIRGVYDGALFWGCPNPSCRRLVHRWPSGHFLHEKAQEVMRRWEFRMPSDDPGPQRVSGGATPWRCDRHGPDCPNLHGEETP